MCVPNDNGKGISFTVNLNLFFILDNIFFDSSYRARHVCWLHNYSLYIGFLLPVAILTVVEFVFFAVILRSITRKAKLVSKTFFDVNVNYSASH